MTEQEILKRALRAAHALTLGGMVAATASCDEPLPEVESIPDTGDLSDTAGDLAADGTATPDTSVIDSGGVDTPTPDVEADVSPEDTGEDAIEDGGGEDVSMADAEHDADTEADAEHNADTEADAEHDADTEADADRDVPTEPDADHDVPPEPDTGEVLCKAEPDRICPDTCTQDNDADCCNEAEGPPCLWVPDVGCMCAVPGPFVPPSMG